MKLILNKSVLAALPSPSRWLAARHLMRLLIRRSSKFRPPMFPWISCRRENCWPQTDWWKDYHDPQLNNLIQRALANAPDMQIAEQRIRLAEAQARMSQANLGPEMDFSADIERQRMSAEGLMGPFATDTDGNTGPWYTNGTFGLTAGWDLDLWGKTVRW